MDRLLVSAHYSSPQKRMKLLSPTKAGSTQKHFWIITDADMVGEFKNSR